MVFQTKLRRLALISLIISLTTEILPAQSQPPAATSVHIQAEVQRLQKFERDIGHALVLRLVPDDNGWDIEVGPKDDTDNYMSCVNAPLHGITPYQIQGWHFRNDANTAPRKPGEFLTPGIGQKREFRFVLTAADQEKSCADLEKMAYTYDTNDPASAAATKRFGELGLGSGSFTITAMSLGNLEPGNEAWIESMQFEADFSFPEQQKGAAKARH